jgi:hypothetical protein
MSLDRSEEKLNFWPVAWFGLLAGVGLVLWCTHTESYIADDSYFYLVIAKNLAVKGEQTFSNVFSTNGFHPLWCYLLAGYTYLVHAVAPNSVNDPVFSVPLAAAMVAGTAIQCWRFARALQLDPLVITALVVGFNLSLGILNSEAPLFFLLLTTLLAGMAREPDVATTHPLWFGLVTAAIILSRLDAIFLVGFVYLYYLWQAGLKPRFVLGAAVCGLIVLAYVVSNMYFFGGAMPVSGWLKSSFPDPFWKGLALTPLAQIQRATLGGFSLLLGWIPLVVGLIALAMIRPPARMQRSLLLILWGGSASLGLYVALFTRSHTAWPWYYVAPLVLTAMSLAIIVSRWQSFFTRGVVLVCISVATICAYAEKLAQQETPAYRVIDYLNDEQLRGQTILVSDWPGAVAYYTDSNVLAADMLTANRFEFEQMRQHSNALEYLIAECQRRHKPIQQIIIIGNDWLIWNGQSQEITFNDPRAYPELEPIGTINVRRSPDGELVYGDDVRVWLAMPNDQSNDGAPIENP